MKTGFIQAYANKPLKKYYSYHGIRKDCLIQPDPSSFIDYPIDWPYGPIQYMSFNNLHRVGWANANANYHTARNATEAIVYIGYVGQDYKTIWWYGYYVMRRGLIFDTSVLPGNARIRSAYIRLWIKADRSGTGFDVVIRNGGGVFPHLPYNYPDYFYANYTGNGGSSPAGGTGNFYIELTPTGLTWIRKGDKTRLALVSSRDIYSANPVSCEYLDVGNSVGNTYLYVAYQLPL